MISDNTDILAPYLGSASLFLFCAPLQKQKQYKNADVERHENVLKVFSFCLGTMAADSRRLACLLKLDLNHQCNSSRKL